METDAASKQRLLMMIALFFCLFGGFAVWGVIQRAADHGGVGDPVPVTPSRAESLARHRRSLLARKQIAALGKTGKWREVVSATDRFISQENWSGMRLLRGEALFRLGDPRGGDAMADVLRGSGAEAALLRGDASIYRSETERVIASVDEATATPLAANNAAWLAAIAPTCDAMTLAKAMRLSEKAVAAARIGGGRVRGDLPTYTNTLGAVYCRAGRESDAVKVLLESEGLQADPFNAAFLALAYARSGDAVSARLWRDRLRRKLDETYATHDAQQYRHQLLLLWRETEGGGQESFAARVK